MTQPKIRPQVLAQIDQAKARKGAGQSDEVSVLVRFRTQEAAAMYGRDLKRGGAPAGLTDLGAPPGQVRARPAFKHEFTRSKLLHLTVTPDTLAELEANPDIEAVFFDAPVYPKLDTSVPAAGVTAAWAAHPTLRGAGVKVCVIDTGIDTSHPDFAGRIVATTNFTTDASVADGHGHGTHVAGTIAGDGTASSGTFKGVAPEAQLLIAKGITDAGLGLTSAILRCLEWGANMGAQVFNLSLGGIGDSSGNDPLSSACNALADDGRVVVVAAGNEGPNATTIGIPAGAAKVITVGSCNDGLTAVSTFSSRGPTTDGDLKPDLLAPGEDVVAARSSLAPTFGTPNANTSYTAANGTSMAAPHVAGLAALALGAKPYLTNATIKALLMATATVLAGTSVYAQGSGMVNGLAFLNAAVGEPVTVRDTAVLDDGVTTSWHIRVREAAVLDDGATPTVRTARTLRERAVLDDATQPSTRRQVTLREAAVLNDGVLVGTAYNRVKETATLDDAATGARTTRSTLRERAQARGEVYTGGPTATLRESAVLNDDHAWYVRRTQTLRESAALNDEALPAARVPGLLRERAELGDRILAVGTLAGVLRERGFISGDPILAPVALAWTANTNSWAMTNYSGHAYDSMTSMFAAGGSGVYGRGAEEFRAHFSTGELTFGSTVRKRLLNVYSLGEAKQPMTLKVTAEVDGRRMAAEYKAAPNMLKSTDNRRWAVGKGFNSATYKLEFAATSDFVMHGAEVLLSTGTRRV